MEPSTFPIKWNFFVESTNDKRHIIEFIGTFANVHLLVHALSVPNIDKITIINKTLYYKNCGSPWYLIAILLRKQTDRSNHVLNIFLSIGPVAISWIWKKSQEIAL